MDQGAAPAARSELDPRDPGGWVSPVPPASPRPRLWDLCPGGEGGPPAGLAPSTCLRGDAPCPRVGSHPSLSPCMEPLGCPLPAKEVQSPEPSPDGPALASTGPAQAPDGAGCRGAPLQQPPSVMQGVQGRASWGCLLGARVAPHVEGATRAGTGPLSGWSTAQGCVPPPCRPGALAAASTWPAPNSARWGGAGQGAPPALSLAWCLG